MKDPLMVSMVLCSLVGFGCVTDGPETSERTATLEAPWSEAELADTDATMMADMMAEVIAEMSAASGASQAEVSALQDDCGEFFLWTPDNGSTCRMFDQCGNPLGTVTTTGLEQQVGTVVRRYSHTIFCPNGGLGREDVTVTYTIFQVSVTVCAPGCGCQTGTITFAKKKTERTNNCPDVRSPFSPF